MTVLRVRGETSALRAGARLRGAVNIELLFEAVSVVAALELLTLEVGHERAMEIVMAIRSTDRPLTLLAGDRTLTIEVTTLGMTPRAKEGSVTATEFLTDDLLDDNDVEGVYVEIYDNSQTLVGEDDMIYDTDADGNGYWYFLWNTSAGATPTLTIGSYRARCTMTDIHGNISIEWKRIRLARQPVTD